jgi:hypothetical protein
MRSAVLLTVFLAGCFDFSALGGSKDMAMQNEPPPDPDGGVPCSTTMQCVSTQNCIAGQCRVALASCAAQKAAAPQSTDGMYWIDTQSGPQLVYCDMKLGTELCTPGTPQQHTGRTREGSNLSFTMMSQFADSADSCDIWALQGTDGFPLGPFGKDLPGITLTQCQTLGFVDDVSLSECRYGTDTAGGYSNCGFTVTTYLAWGHHCSSCAMGNGDWTHYVKMGPFTDGKSLTNVSGTIRARCKTR